MKFKSIFVDDLGLKPLPMIVITAVGVLMLVGSAIALDAWISWRDCPKLCAADSAEPVWTFSEGCGCTKNGDLTKPMAEPVEVNLR